MTTGNKYINAFIFIKERNNEIPILIIIKNFEIDITFLPSKTAINKTIAY